MSDHVEVLLAARDLLVSTKRTLQLLDAEVAAIRAGRAAVVPARDVSSEHRIAWLGATDDSLGTNGIRVAKDVPNPRGFENPFRGTIRNQEDAAFVCTRVLVARQEFFTLQDMQQKTVFSEDVVGDSLVIPLIRLKDGNTGRNLTPGFTTGPLDRDRGAVPAGYLSSFRRGLGSNFKNALFSEFTIPRAGEVRVEVFNLATSSPADVEEVNELRVFVSLLGFKVYGA